MNTQEREAAVEYTHTIEELLEPLADKDPEIIKAFLVTTLEHPLSRLHIWGLATLLKCDPNQYPKVNKIPEIRKLRKGDLTEQEKRHLIDQKAIADIAELLSEGSEIGFHLAYPSPDEALREKDTDLRRVNKELADLTQFRQALRLEKGAGPSTGEVPGKSPV